MTVNKKNNLLWIGTIVNTHGLKGELKILSNSDQVEKQFAVGKILYTEKEQFEITTMRLHKNFVLLTFKDFKDINEVEYLKGTEIYVFKNEEETYLIDLIGYKVINQNKDLIGTVDSFFEIGSYESMRILLATKETTNIPFLDQFIIEIKKEEKEILVDVPVEFYKNEENNVTS